MIALSVNVNKVATIRNSRGGAVPSVLSAVEVCVAAGAFGITVHPRANARHITATDVRDIASCLKAAARSVEYNIEGDPRPDLLELVHEVRPHQCTLVPVQPGEVTSQAGWAPSTRADTLGPVVEQLQKAGVRVSVFVDPDEDAIRWAGDLGADRVELYTEPFARAYDRGENEGRRSFADYQRAAERAHELKLGVNAGHDLDLDNLVMFRHVPHLAEVSIGHALVSRALLVGWARSVEEYLHVLNA